MADKNKVISYQPGDRVMVVSLNSPDGIYIMDHIYSGSPSHLGEIEVELIIQVFPDITRASVSSVEGCIIRVDNLVNVVHPIRTTGWKLNEAAQKDYGFKTPSLFTGENVRGYWVPSYNILRKVGITISARSQDVYTSCRECGNSSKYHQTNCNDGTFVCFSCRTSNSWKFTDLLRIKS